MLESRMECSRIHLVDAAMELPDNVEVISTRIKESPVCIGFAAKLVQNMTLLAISNVAVVEENSNAYFCPSRPFQIWTTQMRARDIFDDLNPGEVGFSKRGASLMHCCPAGSDISTRKGGAGRKMNTGLTMAWADDDYIIVISFYTSLHFNWLLYILLCSDELWSSTVKFKSWNWGFMFDAKFQGVR